jgi:hypothetical protein
LDRIGGFEPTLTNEDYFAVARLLRAGGADCLCGRIPGAAFASLHLEQEFRRYFDTGYVRAENGWVNDLAGHAEGEEHCLPGKCSVASVAKRRCSFHMRFCKQP